MRETEIGGFADAWAALAPVVDVREPWEYRNAHVPGAQLLPLRQPGERVTEIPAGAVVYATCASGNRSAQGLGVAVLLDAVLIRLILLPVLLRLTGHAAWWSPAWLRKALPKINFSH